ncbi:branched-chain amino acid ABC transporter permease [Aeromicrobium sp. LTX1]
MLVKIGALVALVVALFLLPYTWWPGVGLLPGETGSASSLDLLSKVFVLAALAVTFDLLLGQTGLMSLGHGLYFALGAYVFTMLLAYTDLSFIPAAVIAIVGTMVVSVLLNLVALRIDGIPYAMVTLAFAELAAVAVHRNYFGTGGESGLRAPVDTFPTAFVGLQNIANVYWACLALLIVVVAIAWLVIRSPFGLALRGCRDNALRMQILGYDVYLVRLGVSVLASTLAALCGVFFVIALGGTDPETVGMTFALSLIFMVVIGGSGRLAGAVIGGVVYTLLSQRLPAVGAALDESNAPHLLAEVLGEPDLVLGVVFLLVVFLAPKGIVGVFDQLRHRRSSKTATPAVMR